MSAVPQSLPTSSTARALPPLTVLVTGKVEAARRYENKVYTRILSPAPDPYSRPQVVEVRSTERIGGRGEEVSLTARLGGFTRKPYSVTDPETRERVSITPVDHTLDLVE